jgi:endonuclease/exonuclease/phosphatase family metal-dependent hydrolase
VIVGAGKGLVTYHKEMFHHVEDVGEERFQITKFESEEIVSINVYRSASGETDKIIKLLTDMEVAEKVNVISGDMNLCTMKNPKNQLTRGLKAQGYTQLVTEATHIEGGHLDHMYVKGAQTNQMDPVIYHYSPYHSDHDAVCITLTKVSQCYKNLLCF